MCDVLRSQGDTAGAVTKGKMVVNRREKKKSVIAYIMDNSQAGDMVDNQLS